jgi:Histidine kinase
VRWISKLVLALVGVLGVLAVLGTPAAHAARAIDIASFRVQRGDDPGWAAPGFDDTAWRRAPLAAVTEPGGPIWLRATVVVEPATFEADRPIGILFAGLASHEIYWDGVRIGGGGIVGHSEDSEVPGPVILRHWLPSQLATPGSHVIALRLSAFHRTVPVYRPLWLVHVGAYDRLGATPPLYTWIAISSLSGLMLGAVFALVMFFYHRADRAFLYLCALCVTAVALLVAESWRPLFGYTYDWHGLRLVVISSLTWLLNVLVVAFTVVRLPRPGHRRFVAIAAVIMSAAWLAPGWDHKAWLMFLVGLGFAFGWTLLALRTGLSGEALGTPRGGPPGRRSMLAALAVGLTLLVVAPERFADMSIFLSIDLLLLCLVVPYAIERSRERAHRERALVMAARLESELVRKHLQPHFLMNTLTALCEWIDDDPRVAGEMIGALADELRLLHDISDRALIAMEDELALCTAHLQIMSRRKGRAYRLVASGVDPRAQIPPAVFHTLVENAVTHGAVLPATVELRLTGARHGERTRYVFEAPMGGSPGGSPGGGPAAARPEGAGTRYIRARLHESFGTQWTFAAGAAGGVWRTEIEIPSRPA